MAFELPKLPYAFNALEPYIDAGTMEVHHGKHHAGYTNNLNGAIQGSSLEAMPIEAILKDVSKLSPAVRNNGGGFYNHNLFWTVMAPNAGGEPQGEVGKLINKSFGSFSEFKEKFSTAAASRFGSGWAWLVVNDGKLVVGSTPNQDNPLMDISELKGSPILALDVWEHAYYLKYQNRRPEYIGNFFNVINWAQVEKNLNSALG
ncbi:MAG: superoxide dismutase [Bacteroidales bacterium]|nr:superoxide dismutase [Bacteroidales bacterium]MBN2748365.1 superoxide dismutase [Bacteroidales bacterium]